MNKIDLSELEQRLVRELRSWFGERRERLRDKDKTIGLSCTGLLVIERLRTVFPLREEHFLSEGRGQVRGLSGRGASKILERLEGWEPRFLGTEAGRTSRGTPEAARLLADRLNATLEAHWAGLSDEEHSHLIEAMQLWLAKNPILEYFSREGLDVELDVHRPLASNVARILSAAKRRKQDGAVAQHLVGAKLALRFPALNVPNHSVSTADAPSNRPGDFLIESTAFHVTVVPSIQVMEKCKRNLRQRYRVVLLVPDDWIPGAQRMAKETKIDGKVWITSVENFVGQNIEELGEFGEDGLRQQLRRLLEVYNRRVEAVEADRSLLIQIPRSLL